MQGDSALGRVLGLVRDLRRRCPWDRAQTRATLRPYLVEEVLELDYAIGADDPAALRDELGDLLLHLAFQIVIGEERSQFDAEAVTRALEEKMWRRHPLLFGGAAGGGSDHAGWERVKRRERDADRGVLSGLPPTLPPLLAAFRMQERAAGVGFDWPDAAGPRAKVAEELAELDRARAAGPRDAIEDEIGDLLFAAVNLARKLGVEPNQALGRANAKFARRFAGIERLAGQRGVEIGRATLPELDALWDEVKSGEP